MIEIGNIQIEFSCPNDWDYSAAPFNFQEVIVKIWSQKFSYENCISFETEESPLQFFIDINGQEKSYSAWQSMCQELMINFSKNDNGFHVNLNLNGDSEDFESANDIKIMLSVVQEEIRIDINKLKTIFTKLRQV
jgi:hypothetical protein